MSGIAKPLIRTAAPSLVTDAANVGVENIVSMTKTDITSIPGREDEFQIVFALTDPSGGRRPDVVWAFKDEDERNSVYANAETYAAETIAHT